MLVDKSNELLHKYNSMNKDNSNSRVDRYFQTKTLKRLQGIGLFCGMDYVGIEDLKPICYYSRLDHSKNVAYTASKLSDDFSCVLAGAFHDVGTLSFSHVNSFKNGDSLTQSRDELSVKPLLLRDDELLTYLDEDGIDIDDVSFCEKYPLIDKPIPSLCLDRVEGGIFATCLFWAHSHTFEEIEDFYNMLCYFENLNGMCFDISSKRLREFNGEIVLNNHFSEYDYEDFFRAINVYSKKLLSKESRYMMEIFGAMFRYYEYINLITEKDLFKLSEKEVIEKILDSKYRDIFIDVTSFDEVSYAKDLDDGFAVISKPKIRYATPLCFGQMTVCEIADISGDFYQGLNPLWDDILLTDRPIKGNLRNETVKILSKYKNKI